MPLSADMRDFIVANVASLDAAEVFIGGLPESPDQVVAVVVPDGGSPVLAMGDGNVIERQQQFTVLSRGPLDGYAVAETQAEEVFAALAAVTERTINGRVYDKIVAASDVFAIEVERTERPLFSCKYDAWSRGA